MGTLNMVTSLPDDLRQAIEKEGGSPVHLVDAATNARYMLMRAEQYENLKTLFVEDEELDARALYPLLAKSAATAGWADPEMDVTTTMMLTRSHDGEARRCRAPAHCLLVRRRV
jgi:hypothetical protein